MVQLEWLTGARPSEICRLRAGDIIRTGRVRIRGVELLDLDAAGVWIAILHQHKTSWRSKSRWLTFGPAAQAILTRYLDRPADQYLFSPRETVTQLREQMRKARLDRGGGSGGNRKPKSATGDRISNLYTPRSYRQAIARACRRAGVPHWYPYQLRHLAAAEVKAVMGIEGVQALLGHHTQAMANHYGGVSAKLAIEAAQRNLGGHSSE